jgi:hypothetical protein
VYNDNSSPEFIAKESITIANGPFENVAKLKYLGMTLTSQNLTQEEIRSRLNFTILIFSSFVLI